MQNRKKIKKAKKTKRYFYLGIAAAFLLAFGFWGFSNPVLAGKIPFLGRIFRLVENDIGYSGNYSENAVPITDPNRNQTGDGNSDSSDTQGNGSGDGAETDSSVSDDNAYSQTVDGVTVTLSEVICSELALYFSVEIYNEEPFPDDFNWVKNREDYILSYDLLYMKSTQQFDFSKADPSRYFTDIVNCSTEEGLPTPYRIEGNYADSHTFLGVVRVDLAILQRRLQADALPPEFTYSFTLLDFWHDLNTIASVTETTTADGYPVTIQNPEEKHYTGPWSFTIPVSRNPDDTQMKEIMETNANGVGIANVTKTPYEMKAEIILPENVSPADYIIAITDADGRLLDSQGEMAEIYSVYGRNTDTIHIYVVDHVTFMNECKGDNDYLLPEKALFQTTVTW